MIDVIMYLFGAYTVMMVLAVFTYFGVELYNRQKLKEKIKSPSDCHRRDSARKD